MLCYNITKNYVKENYAKDTKFKMVKYNPGINRNTFDKY